MEAFLSFNKQNPAYILALFCHAHLGARKLSLLGRDWELPNPFPQASVGTERHSGPCCLILLSFLARYTILMVTLAKKLVKTEA